MLLLTLHSLCLPFLRNEKSTRNNPAANIQALLGWAYSCLTYMRETKIFHVGYTPTLEEYFNTSVVPVGGLINLFCSYLLTTDKITVEALRRIVEADEFMRAGLYDGWLPHLFVGNFLKGQTFGVIGARRIGSAYARMMIEGTLIRMDEYSTGIAGLAVTYGINLNVQQSSVIWNICNAEIKMISVERIL